MNEPIGITESLLEIQRRNGGETPTSSRDKFNEAEDRLIEKMKPARIKRKELNEEEN